MVDEDAKGVYVFLFAFLLTLAAGGLIAVAIVEVLT
jgi:hypothetical protein